MRQQSKVKMGIHSHWVLSNSLTCKGIRYWCSLVLESVCDTVLTCTCMLEGMRFNEYKWLYFTTPSQSCLGLANEPRDNAEP
jgi:hypothetical protein